MEFDERMSDETKAHSAFWQQVIPKLQAMDLSSIRMVMDSMDNEVNQKHKFDGLEFVDHVVNSIYDDFKIPVTLYLPKNRKSSAHIVAFFHGGAFQLMTSKTYHRTVAYLAQATNSIWVSVDFRRAPEFKHPIAIRDCISVTKWILENKTEAFGSDENAKVGVCGDSAGGNLAAFVAHEFKNKLAFQVLVYPWLDLLCSSKTYEEFEKLCYMLPKNEALKYAADYLNEGQDPSSPLVSPFYIQELSSQPKTLVINAELEPVIHEGFQYSERLKAANVPCHYVVIKGAIHGFFSSQDTYMNTFYESSQHVIKFLQENE
jgi:acetyl esterase